MPTPHRAWFASRGVPQLVAGYSTEQRMDAGAVAFMAVHAAYLSSPEVRGDVEAPLRAVGLTT